MFHFGVENRMQNNVCNMVKIHKIKLYTHVHKYTQNERYGKISS